jgi:hypothetical protein
MTVKDWMLSIPGPARQSQVGIPNPALTATGTTQATAKQVSTDFEIYTTVAASSGCILPANMSVADQGWIINHGANSLTVYPPVGGKLANAAINTGFAVAAGKGMFWICLDNLNFGASVSA